MENIASIQIISEKYEQLENILRQMISNSARELCNEMKSEKKYNPSSDILRPKLFVSIQRPDDSEVNNLALVLMDQRKQTGGRKMKNHVVGEKVVCFDLPDDFDAESIHDIEKIKERLGKWRIQRRQRDSKMNDTFYCHLSSRRTFRTIPEVLSFIMFGPRTKKTSASDDRASSSKGENMMIPKLLPSKRLRDDKGKIVSTPQGLVIDKNKTHSNLALSIMPWRPLEPHMNKYYFCQCSRKILWKPEPLRMILCEPKPDKLSQERNKVMMDEKNLVDLTQDSDSEMSDVTQDKVDHSTTSKSPLKRRRDIKENYTMFNLQVDHSTTSKSPLKRRRDIKENYTMFNLQVDHSTTSKSPLKRGRDIQQETVEDETFYGLEILDECKELMGGTAFDELVVENKGNKNNNVTLVPPHGANKEAIGKENKQALITTKPVEYSVNVTTESSNKQNKNSKDNSNGGADIIRGLEEAMQKLPHVELEGVDDEFYHFQYGACFSDRDDPLNHVSVDDYISC